MADEGSEASAATYQGTPIEMGDNLAPDVIEVLNTQSDRDLRWFHVFPNGQMILLSYDLKSNASLRLYSADKQFLLQLELPRALSAATLDNHQLIVPLRETRQLQIVNINVDNLTMGLDIKTNVVPWLTLKYSDGSLLVLGKQSDSNFCFQILELNGTLQRHVILCTELSTPINMRMSEDNTVVYVVDTMKGCLGFNLQGDVCDVLFHYTRADHVCYFGLALDPRGCVYFSVEPHTSNRAEQLASKYVMKLSSNGQVLSQIHVGICPFQCDGNKMYGIDRNDQNEVVIRYIHV